MHQDVIFHTPFFYYAPISFATPMLGAAQGAYEHFRDWTKTRQAQDGSSVAEKTSVQVRMARAAADLDAADLLLRRAVNVDRRAARLFAAALARSVRDFARVSELTVSVIDTLDRLERHGELQHLASAAARLARHPLHVDAYRRQHRDEFFALRPHGARPGARCEPAVFLSLSSPAPSPPAAPADRRSPGTSAGPRYSAASSTACRRGPSSTSGPARRRSAPACRSADSRPSRR